MLCLPPINCITPSRAAKHCAKRPDDYNCVWITGQKKIPMTLLLHVGILFVLCCYVKALGSIKTNAKAAICICICI